MTLKSITALELAQARRAGFRKKKPKKPRRTATVLQQENFASRWNEWVTQARAKVASKKVQERNAEAIAKLRV